MELKKGYKQTDIGIIPDDWNINSILECSHRITDGEHLTPKRTESGYYLLSARNILNGRIDLSDVDYVGFEEYRRIRLRCNPEFGDVLISCSGSIGRVTLVPENFKCVMVRSAALIKPDLTKTFGLYIQYYLQSKLGQKQIFASLNQGAQANLFLNHIQGLKLAFPSLPEQNAITAILSCTDSLIISLEKLIGKKRNIKQGVMQKLLQPQVGWVIKKLGDIATIEKGEQLNKSELTDKGKYPALNGGINPSGYTNKWNTNENTITISEGGNSCGYVNFNTEKFWKGGHCYSVQSNNGKLDKGFLYHLLKFNQKQIMNLRVGSGLPNIQKSSLNNFPLSIMNSILEQINISTILSDMDTEIEVIEAKLEKYRNIKQGMMQNLLTGKIRLV